MRHPLKQFALCLLIAGRLFAQEGAREADTGVCPLELLRRSFSFGNAYDLFSRAKAPDLAKLTDKAWILTGIASHKDSAFVWGTEYNPTGYQVDRSIPRLQFVPRTELAEGTADYYALRRNWGDADKEGELAPAAAFIPSDWRDYPAIKTTSVTWGHPLFKNDIFAAGKNNPLSRSQIRYFCRTSGEALICLGEYYRYRRGELTAEQASLFLLFETPKK